MRRLFNRIDRTIWTRNLILFAVAGFFARFGQGLTGSVRMNFFVDTIGLSSERILWLEGIRELPGLALIFFAALTMRLPLRRQAALSVLLMGVGYALYATVHSYAALLTVAIVASFGFHLWTPLNSAIGMSLAGKEKAGRVLGGLSSVGSLASIAGMGVLAVVSRLFASASLSNYYLLGGAMIAIGALLILRLPSDLGVSDAEPPRILVRRRYWLYYVLIFFSGARKLVLSSFVTLVLVQNFDLQVWHISTLMLIGSILNLLLAPYLGSLIDRFGERRTTPIAYAALALCCVGYATIANLWVLVGLWVIMQLAAPLGMGLSTYVYRTAPSEELTPTLTAGVTFDHISSVGMPFLAGAAIPAIGYEGIFVITAILILISIPFARLLFVRVPASPQAVATAAD
jgi:predicted MFS family arabinose efflux permease